MSTTTQTWKDTSTNGPTTTTTSKTKLDKIIQLKSGTTRANKTKISKWIKIKSSNCGTRTCDSGLVYLLLFNFHDCAFEGLNKWTSCAKSWILSDLHMTLHYNKSCNKCIGRSVKFDDFKEDNYWREASKSRRHL